MLNSMHNGDGASVETFLVEVVNFAKEEVPILIKFLGINWWG